MGNQPFRQARREAKASPFAVSDLLIYKRVNLKYRLNFPATRLLLYSVAFSRPFGTRSDNRNTSQDLHPGLFSIAPSGLSKDPYTPSVKTVYRCRAVTILQGGIKQTSSAVPIRPFSMGFF